MPLRLPAVTAPVAALLFFALVALFAASAQAAAFTDAAGRRVMLPDHVRRVLPAEPNAAVLVFVLAPDKLAVRRTAKVAEARYAPPVADPAALAATARRVGADLIVDASAPSPGRAAFADQVQRLSGVPYILADNSFARMPRMLRTLGAILGAGDRVDDLATYAEHAIAGLRGQLLIRPADTRPRVYYGLGAGGLAPALPGSPAAAALAEAGAINVAAATGTAPISPQQLVEWNPQIIIAERRSFYDALRRHAGWRRLAAVRNHAVYLEPSRLFGWIDDPDGVNRLIGLHWLSTVLYPDATQEDLRTTTCEFYAKFYRIKLTNAQVEAMVGPAGAPPLPAPRPVAEPLVGLGAAPPSTLPGSASGNPAAAGAPAPANPVAPDAAAGAPTPALPGIATNTAPSDQCIVATGPSPQPLPGITGSAPTGLSPLPPAAAPGVPPPGRRGHPPPQ